MGIEGGGVLYNTSFATSCDVLHSVSSQSAPWSQSHDSFKSLFSENFPLTLIFV